MIYDSSGNYANAFGANLAGKKVCVLGDSLTYQSSGYTGGIDSLGFATGQIGGDGWMGRIAGKYGFEWKAYCNGSMQMWYNNESRPNGAPTAVANLISSGYTPDIIVLEFGTNDVWSAPSHIGSYEDTASATATTTVGGMRYAIETLQANFPNAEIVAILPMIRTGANGAISPKVAPHIAMADMVMDDYCIRRAYPNRVSGITLPMMSTDGVHLRDSTTFSNKTEAVRRYSACLESVLLSI